MRVDESARGFTLLEVLVAFTLCAFVLAAALQVFSGGLGGTAASQRHVIATMMAQSKLAELETEQPVVVGRQAGTAAGGYRWQAEVAPYTELNSDDLVNSPVALYQLTVEVAWGTAGSNRAITLTTLRATSPSGDDAAGQDAGQQ